MEEYEVRQGGQNALHDKAHPCALFRLLTLGDQ